MGKLFYRHVSPVSIILFLHIDNLYMLGLFSLFMFITSDICHFISVFCVLLIVKGETVVCLSCFGRGRVVTQHFSRSQMFNMFIKDHIKLNNSYLTISVFPLSVTEVVAQLLEGEAIFQHFFPSYDFETTPREGLMEAVLSVNT